MTPKQAYERRRAEREEKVRESEKRYGRPNIMDQKEADMADLLDRFVTAVERIAEAMER